MVERSRRRFERHLEEARLPPGKTLDAFDFDAVPMVSKAQVQALAAGDAWLEKDANLLCFGPPGALVVGAERTEINLMLTGELRGAARVSDTIFRIMLI